MLKLAFNSALWTPTKADWILAGRLIQVEERKRIAEYCFKNDAKLCLAARLLLRYAVVKCSTLKWNEFNLTRSTKGKPWLDSQYLKKGMLYFNASHQGDYAVVVADCNANVGVDIMDTRETHGDVNDFFALMDRHFTVEEWSTICNCANDKEQMNSFYRHWCLKESFVKAIGDGLSYSLQSLNFRVKSQLTKTLPVTDTLLYTNGELNSDWSFEEVMLDPNHCVAVAKNTTNTSVNCGCFKCLTFQEVSSISACLELDECVDEQFLLSYNNPFKIRLPS